MGFFGPIGQLVAQGAKVAAESDFVDFGLHLG